MYFFLVPFLFVRNMAHYTIPFSFCQYIFSFFLIFFCFFFFHLFYRSFLQKKFSLFLFFFDILCIVFSVFRVQKNSNCCYFLRLSSFTILKYILLFHSTFCSVLLYLTMFPFHCQYFYLLFLQVYFGKAK